MWDTDVVGILMEYFGFAGESYCVGGASAAGAVATIHAARQLQASALDACIAVGPLFDLSRWECQALTNLGAMGSGAFADDPLRACRPFDEQHDGFVYGEGCAALVLERLDTAQRAHGTVLGWAQVYDGTRGPEPHTRGQQRAIMDALRMAELEPGQIDYVNPHGTGSPRGDRTELESLETVGLKHCWINATKSLTGHCLTASGAIEVVATLLQLRSGFLHPNRNLERPIDASFRWVPDHVLDTDLRFAVSTSFAFGGLSTALVLGPPPTSA
jgi:malonyl-ACP decarboxylase